jgi:hypothetical protein
VSASKDDETQDGGGNGGELTPEPGSATAGEISEDASPAQDRPVLRPQAQPPHPDSVRMWLAIGMVLILTGIVGVACYGWIDGRDLESMQALAIVLSPVVTLVGTILGFYFSSSARR